MRRWTWFVALAACSGAEESATDDAFGTATLDEDLCDGTGSPAVSVGDTTNGVFAPWGETVVYLPETVSSQGAGGTGSIVHVGIAAPNFALDTFTMAHLVVTEGASPKIDATVPIGVTCDPTWGWVGSTPIAWPWETVDGALLTFALTVDDGAGQVATGEATVTVIGG